MHISVHKNMNTSNGICNYVDRNLYVRHANATCFNAGCWTPVLQRRRRGVGFVVPGVSLDRVILSALQFTLTSTVYPAHVAICTKGNIYIVDQVCTIFI
jgi:hypothetical protein